MLAESLSRASIFAALKSRRCYGTTGPRIDLAFEIEGHAMGSLLEWKREMRVEASVAGTAPIESLALYRGKEVIESFRPAAFATSAASRRIRVRWQGSRIRGRGRRVTWDGAIHVTGATIELAMPHSFDSPADGIVSQTASEVAFTSGTTGDVDGIDLWLDQASSGTLEFDSKAGSCSLDLAQLTTEPLCFDFGGLGIRLCVERYPEVLTAVDAALSTMVSPAKGETTPYFVKAVQEDGHMAWSSPIYVG
ncbi:MAG: hypothetical protein HC802_06740 [Caldilineaceae bacterium]|nr:hypothetical protein [Caldilineaceae bacterium]